MVTLTNNSGADITVTEKITKTTTLTAGSSMELDTNTVEVEIS